jgi:hypothetical protein
MCELLNLNLENKRFLSKLEEGQCIVRANSIKEPFLLSIPHIKHESITTLGIIKKNQSLLNQSAIRFHKEEKNPLQNYKSLYYTKDREANLSNDNLKLESFENLKTYLNHLYNLQKKKE